MLDNAQKVMQELLQSKNNLVRRATMVVTFPVVTVACVAIGGAQAAKDYIDEVSGELPFVVKSAKECWKAPYKS